MKRVRYLAGAAGLAPVAFGLAAAPIAQAATGPAAATAAGLAKTVSLHHILRPEAGAGAITSRGSSAGVPAVPPGVDIAAGCKANPDSLKSGTHINLSVAFSYAHAGLDRACIGHVNGVMQYRRKAYKCEWGRIYHNGHLLWDLDRGCATKQAGGSLSVGWRVNHPFPTPVKVCVKSTYDTVGACNTVG